MFPSMNLSYIRKSVTWDLMRLKMDNCKVSNSLLHRLKFRQHARYQTWCGESWSVRWESGITSNRWLISFMGINQKAISIHMKQHFPTSDCWANVELSKQKLTEVRRNWKNEYLQCNAKVQERCCTQWLECMHNPRFFSIC